MSASAEDPGKLARMIHRTLSGLCYAAIVRGQGGGTPAESVLLVAYYDPGAGGWVNEVNVPHDPAPAGGGSVSWHWPHQCPWRY